MASAQTLKQRNPTIPSPSSKVDPTHEESVAMEHPAGDVKHGGVAQVLRCLFFMSYFIAGSCRYSQPRPILFIVLSNHKTAY